MARSVADTLAQYERFLPPRYAAVRAYLAGIAAVMQSADATVESMADSSTVGGAEGVWLTLLARGHGIYPNLDETEASLRQRIRYIENQVTRSAILDAVNAMLAEYADVEATMLEPKDAGFLDADCWLDSTVISDLHNGFVLVCPEMDDEVWGDSYADDEYLDSDTAYLGGGADHPIYLALIAVVERIRAAGVRWRLFIDRD